MGFVLRGFKIQNQRLTIREGGASCSFNRGGAFRVLSGRSLPIEGQRWLARGGVATKRASRLPRRGVQFARYDKS